MCNHYKEFSCIFSVNDIVMSKNAVDTACTTQVSGEDFNTTMVKEI